MNGSNIVHGISKTPSFSYFNAHYFCDYIELLALLNNTDIVSASDIYDRFLEDGKIEKIGSEESAEINDKWESRIDEWFTLLQNRQDKFGDLYPFLINENTIKLNDTIDSKKNSYIFLLLSSTRQYIKDGNLLTTDFERVSYEALKNYLPSFTKIFQFGKSNISANRYTGHITNKIDTLARDLKYRTKYKRESFATTNTGDGGVDIVAWVPFEEDENNCKIQVYLGQCATGNDWLKKQDETNYFNNYIDFEAHLNYVMFMPYDGRNRNSTFNEEAKMGDYLYFDRFRLLKMINNYSLVETLPSFDEIVQRVIDFEEDIV